MTSQLIIIKELMNYQCCFSSQKEPKHLGIDKKDLFSSLVHSENYARDRKLADLSSSSIFGGYYMNPIKKHIASIIKEEVTVNIQKQQKQKLALANNAQDLDESLEDSLNDGRAQSVQQKRNMDNPNHKKKFRPVKLRWVKNEGHSASWQPSDTSVTVFDEQELKMYISPHRSDFNCFVHYDYEDEEPPKGKEEAKQKVQLVKPNTAAKKKVVPSAARKGPVQKKKK